MIRLLIAGLLLVSVNTVAATQVTHTFEDGDIIKAEEFNKNFDDLEAAINTVLSTPSEGAIALSSQAAIALTSTSANASGISLTSNGGTDSLWYWKINKGLLTHQLPESDAGGITLSTLTGIVLNSGAGNVAASGNVTATGFINTSDARLKRP